jgi:L-tyrosine peroxygenase
MMQEPAYGDYPYGLEPLVLPGPDEPWLEAGKHGFESGNVAYRPVPAGAEDVCPATRAWFRWITGHQLSFLIWRFIASGCDLRYVASVDARAVSQLVAGYSAALGFASFMSPGEYAGTVRPAMERTHRGFSGSWAPDYRPIRDLMLSPRRSAAALGAGADELIVRIRECHDVHREVANRLVPTKVSLLQGAGMPAGGAGTQAATDLIYDAFFVVARRPVSYASALEQFERRVHAVTADLKRSKDGAEPGCDGFTADVIDSIRQRLHDALTSAAQISVLGHEGAVL